VPVTNEHFVCYKIETTAFGNIPNRKMFDVEWNLGQLVTYCAGCCQR